MKEKIIFVFLFLLFILLGGGLTHDIYKTAKKQDEKDKEQ